ncbi:pectin lyase-like protein, partial [Auricularia subglabra TFB-10046 SS5]
GLVADGGAQYWVNQNNFYRSLRNLAVDMTQLPVEAGTWGTRCQVSQATSIYNLRVEASKDPATNHVGVFMENAFGGYMGRMVFNGGKRALDPGNQQFTVRNVEVNDAQVAIYTNWKWAWTFLDNCGIAFLINTGGNVDAQTVGAQNIVDATIANTKIFVQTTSNQPDSLAGSLLIDKAELKGVETAVADKDGGVLLAGGDKHIDQYYIGTSNSPKYVRGEQTAPNKPESLLDNGKFVGRTRPQYADVSPDDIISVRAEGAKGDGKTDNSVNSDAIQAVFDKYAGWKLVFDHGMYIVTKTINIPVGAQMVGEAWTQLMLPATTSRTSSTRRLRSASASPATRALSRSPTLHSPRAARPPAPSSSSGTSTSPRAAGTWDTFMRIGGAEGTNLNLADCLKLQNTGAPECTDAFLGLHITQKASAYFERLWVWLADHDIDHNDSTQISIFSGRGIYSESAGPVWLIGTGSEHHILYQHNLVGAEDHFLALIQTESPYFQPQPVAPAPECQWDDPTDFTSRSSWALRVYDSENALVYGAGTYSFFDPDNYAQECIPNHTCQQQINDISSDPENVRIFSLSAVASTQMLSDGVKGVIDEKRNESGFQSAVAYWSQ